MFNIIITFIGSILLLFGIVSMVTPIPGGTIMIATSLTMLICSSPTVRKCIRYTRTNVNWFDKFFSFLESKIGTKIKFIGEALAKTRTGAIDDVI